MTHADAQELVAAVLSLGKQVAFVGWIVYFGSIALLLQAWISRRRR